MCPSSTRIITPEDGTTIIETGLYGPPPPGMFYLIIGRASCSLKGLSVIPSVVDADYKGEIKLLATATEGPLTLRAGHRIAQALPLPMIGQFPCQGNERGASSPGSSDVYWVQQLSDTRPMMTLWLDNKQFQGLLDTGADATVLSSKYWPKAWPVDSTATHLQGIGQTQSTLQSSKLLTWKDKEGNSGTIQPFIVPGLPVNLWGRDILKQMGVIMLSPNEVVTKQMLNMGFLPGKGLGKEGQGPTGPVTVKQCTDRLGVGADLFS